MRHELAGLLRQSIYVRLAVYMDVNDHERLFRDPAMRLSAVKIPWRNAACSQTVSRFEKAILTREENLETLVNINHAWVSKAMHTTGARHVILDMDSSEFPVNAAQKGSACNAHFRSRCCHPR